MAISSPMTDVLMHQKDATGAEVIAFPISRYATLIGAPKVIKNVEHAYGAPYVLLEMEEIDIPIEEVRTLCGPII